MRAINRRINTIEKKLNIGNDRTGLCIILIGKRDADVLPEPLEEWITYKQEKAKCGGRGTVHIAMLTLEAELKAREELKTTNSETVQ